MIIEYVSVKTGNVLDTVTVPENGDPPTYDTELARRQVETLVRVTKTRERALTILRDWTNGYVQLREVANR